MKSIALSGMALLLSAGLAFAADPATDPAASQDLKGLSPSGPTAKQAPPTANPSSSGRPSAILDQAECENVWNEAVDGGSDLMANKAGKYVSNFEQADADDDGKISQTEFKEACNKGWVQAEATGAGGMQSESQSGMESGSPSSPGQ